MDSKKSHAAMKTIWKCLFLACLLRAGLIFMDQYAAGYGLTQFAIDIPWLRNFLFYEIDFEKLGFSITPLKGAVWLIGDGLLIRAMCCGVQEARLWYQQESLQKPLRWYDCASPGLLVIFLCEFLLVLLAEPVFWIAGPLFFIHALQQGEKGKTKKSGLESDTQDRLLMLLVAMGILCLGMAVKQRFPWENGTMLLETLWFHLGLQWFTLALIPLKRVICRRNKTLYQVGYGRGTWLCFLAVFAGAGICLLMCAYGDALEYPVLEPLLEKICWIHIPYRNTYNSFLLLLVGGFYFMVCEKVPVSQTDSRDVLVKHRIRQNRKLHHICWTLCWAGIMGILSLMILGYSDLITPTYILMDVFLGERLWVLSVLVGIFLCALGSWILTAEVQEVENTVEPRLSEWLWQNRQGAKTYRGFQAFQGLLMAGGLLEEGVWLIKNGSWTGNAVSLPRGIAWLLQMELQYDVQTWGDALWGAMLLLGDVCLGLGLIVWVAVMISSFFLEGKDTLLAHSHAAAIFLYNTVITVVGCLLGRTLFYRIGAVVPVWAAGVYIYHRRRRRTPAKKTGIKGRNLINLIFLDVLVFPGLLACCYDTELIWALRQGLMILPGLLCLLLEIRRKEKGSVTHWVRPLLWMALLVSTWGGLYSASLENKFAMLLAWGALLLLCEMALGHYEAPKPLTDTSSRDSALVALRKAIAVRREYYAMCCGISVLWCLIMFLCYDEIWCFLQGVEHSQWFFILAIGVGLVLAGVCFWSIAPKKETEQGLPAVRKRKLLRQLATWNARLKRNGQIFDFVLYVVLGLIFLLVQQPIVANWAYMDVVKTALGLEYLGELLSCDPERVLLALEVLMFLAGAYHGVRWAICVTAEPVIQWVHHRFSVSGLDKQVATEIMKQHHEHLKQIAAGKDQQTAPMYFLQFPREGTDTVLTRQELGQHPGFQMEWTGYELGEIRQIHDNLIITRIN